MKIPMNALMLMAFALPALARDSTWDLRCLVTDTAGNKLTYSFGMQLEDKSFLRSALLIMERIQPFQKTINQYGQKLTGRNIYNLNQMSCRV